MSIVGDPNSFQQFNMGPTSPAPAPPGSDPLNGQMYTVDGSQSTIWIVRYRDFDGSIQTQYLDRSQDPDVWAANNIPAISNSGITVRQVPKEGGGLGRWEVDFGPDSGHAPESFATQEEARAAARKQIPTLGQVGPAGARTHTPGAAPQQTAEQAQRATLGAGAADPTVGAYLRAQQQAAQGGGGAATPATPATPSVTPGQTTTDTGAAPTGTTGTTPASTLASMSDDAIVQYIRQTYGFESWMLDEPSGQLKKILINAIRQGIDPTNPVGEAQIISQVEQSDFGKTHTAAQIQFLNDKAQHPGDYDPNNPSSLTAERIQTLRNEAAQLGVHMTDARLAQLADMSLQNGWSPGSAELEHALRAEFSYRPANTKGNIPATMGPNGYLVDSVTGRRAYYGPNGEPGGPSPFPGAASFKQSDGTIVYYTPGDFGYANSQLSGQAATLTTQYQKLAHDYNLNLSPDQINKYVTATIQQQDPDGAGYQEYLKQMAKAMYPYLGTMIDQGFTPGQILAPYQSTISTMLGLPADSIDFTNPKYKNLLTSVGPDGTPTLNSEFQMQKMVRADPSYGWQNTPDANNIGAQFTTKLAQTFGELG